MKNIRIFHLKNIHFLVVKISVYLNRRVFVMCTLIALIYYMYNMYNLSEKHLLEIRRKLKTAFRDSNKVYMSKNRLRNFTRLEKN